MMHIFAFVHLHIWHLHICTLTKADHSHICTFTYSHICTLVKGAHFTQFMFNLFDRMKLPFRKNKEFLSALYDILGFYPHDIEIYRIAFSHKSLAYQMAKDNSKGAKTGATGKDRKGASRDRRDRKPHSENTQKPLNNERLEYLGDAVLETVVSDILFRHFPHKREGFLTSTRSKIVQREALNRLASEMGLEKLILAAEGTRMSHTNIGGNAFEALMGAIYLDRGFKYCHWFITNRVVGQYVDLDTVAQKEVNFKSKLLEWSQKNHININFKDSYAGDEKGFRTVITLEGLTIARGVGRSKKESQQEASKEALTRMRHEPNTYDNIFRAKEKRTAMEAEESFALPKIDEIEESLTVIDGKVTKKGKKKDKATAPVLEERKSNAAKSAAKAASDEAYDAAYDASAAYEVIDTPPAEEVVTEAFCEEKGLPAPPQEDELKEADDKLRKKRTRNRGPKTLGDAVKGVDKGATTAEEKAEKREAERLAEVERQRAKAERKRQEAEKAKAKAEAELQRKQAEEAKAEAERKARQKAESKAKAEKARQEAEQLAREQEELLAQAEAALLEQPVAAENVAEAQPAEAEEVSAVEEQKQSVVNEVATESAVITEEKDDEPLETLTAVPVFADDEASEVNFTAELDLPTAPEDTTSASEVDSHVEISTLMQALSTHAQAAEPEVAPEAEKKTEEQVAEEPTSTAERTIAAPTAEEELPVEALTAAEDDLLKAEVADEIVAEANEEADLADETLAVIAEEAAAQDATDFIIKEDLKPLEEEIADAEEVESDLNSFGTAETEVVNKVADEVSSKTEVSSERPITFDTLVFGTEHDNLGVMADEEVASLEETAVPRKRNNNHRRRRGNGGNKKPRENGQPSAVGEKSSDAVPNTDESRPNEAAKKRKYNHHRRRGGKKGSAPTAPAAPVAE